jgi:hypothetical protein
MPAMRFLIIPLLAFSCAAQEYFPPAAFSEKADLQQFRAGWYSSQLKALQELPLWSKEPPKGKECYRFTWLRSFHHPAVFRLDVQKDGSGTLTIKVADGEGGYEPGKLIRNETSKLSAEQVQAITGRFERFRFFELQSYDDKIGNDGSKWIIEALAGGRYHVVDRFAPQNGPIHDLGMVFIEMAIGGDLTPIY